MSKYLEQTMVIKRALQRIWTFPFPAEFRRTLCWEYLMAFVFGRTDSVNKTVRLAGIDFHYCTFGALQYLFGEIFLRQSYHFTSQREDPVILDCGSNIGMSVLYFKCLYPKSRITAFEPQTEAFQCLDKNVAQPRLNGVAAHAAALASRRGEIAFYTDDKSPGSLLASQIEARMPKYRQIVPAVKLSDYVTGTVDLLKLDIEGAESEVLGELIESDKIRQIEQMVIEYHHHIVSGDDLLAAFLGRLESAGFGYQIEGKLKRPFRRGHFQDICIYAYRK